ncbi:30S ribosomal protein S15 [Candidatus Dependentiae bacterium]
MAITKEEKEKLVSQYRINDSDTGSVQLQIAMLSEHIKCLTEHLKENKKDFSSKRGLFKMISRRRRFLKYLEREDENQYRELIKRLELKR